MNRLIIVFLFLTQIVFSQTKLTVKEVNELKLKVKETAKNTETITSDFIQYKHLEFLTNEIKTEGKLLFKSPNLIKWEYQKPYKYIAIFKDDKLYINDEGDKNNFDIGSNKLFKNFNDMIINSIKGNLFNDEDFIMEYYKTKKTYLVSFKPENEMVKGLIASFELTFDSKTTDVVEIKMKENKTDYTKIIFKNKQLNKQISNEAFNH
ncbi:LolA family protein [Tenacibaculum halocynthiae]|uniref:LolA family protein n=1 Tax=Tenacibaculum halocynthiae TaxID=1254437 RepID=UPI003895D2EE